MPHEQKRHGRFERSEHRVVNRNRLVAFVVGAEQDSIVRIRGGLQDALDIVKEALCTISRQVSEHNDDHVVVSVVTASGLSRQEQFLVAGYEFDNIWRAPFGDLLGREPEDLAFQ